MLSLLLNPIKFFMPVCGLLTVVFIGLSYSYKRWLAYWLKWNLSRFETIANSKSKAEKSRDRAISFSIDSTESPHTVSVDLRHVFMSLSRENDLSLDATVTGIVIKIRKLIDKLEVGPTSFSIIIMQIAQHINWWHNILWQNVCQRLELIKKYKLRLDANFIRKSVSHSAKLK